MTVAGKRILIGIALLASVVLLRVAYYLWQMGELANSYNP